MLTVRQALCVGPGIALILGLSTCLAQPARQNRVSPAPDAPAEAHQQQMQVLAVVNGHQITREQIANACLSRFGESVLESIVNKQLVFNECQRAGIIITEQDVNDEIVRKAASFNMSADAYLNLICTQRKLNEDRYKNDFVWQEMALRRLAASEIEVTPQDIQERIETEFGAKVQIREIVCPGRGQAAQLLAEARQDPARFGQLAKTRSANPNSAAVKGLLPPISRHTAPPELEQLVFAMQPGDVSDVIEVAGQLLIVKCERVFPAVEVAPQDLPAVHERIIDELSEDRLAQAAVGLFERLQQTVRIVNVYNDKVLSQQQPGVAATLDGVPITLDFLAEECIARFGTPMLSAEINRLVLQQELQRRNIQVTEADITEEIGRAAEADGFTGPDGKPNIDGWIASMTGDDLSRTDALVADTVWPTCALKKLVAGEVTVSEDDLQKGFSANYGPRVEVLAIVFNDHRQALKVWQMAAANRSEEYFGQLANQYSVDPASQANFGQVPPIQRHGGKPELEEEAFSLAAGEISKVIQEGENYLILFCTGQTTPVVTEFAAVRDLLFKHILDQKTYVAMGEKGRQLFTDSQIDNFLEGTSQPGKAAEAIARQAGNPQR